MNVNFWKQKIIDIHNICQKFLATVDYDTTRKITDRQAINSLHTLYYISGYTDGVKIMNMKSQDWFLDKDNVKYMTDVMLAYLDGKKIEYKIDGTDSYKEVDMPCWNWESGMYRIKEVKE